MFDDFLRGVVADCVEGDGVPVHNDATEARDLLAQIVKARDEEDTRGLHELIEFARTLLAEGGC